MAGNVNAPAHPFDLDIMHVEDIGKFRHDVFELPLQAPIAADLVAGFDGRGLAFNVGQDGGNLRHFLFDFRLQLRDLLVRFHKVEPLIELEMLLDVQLVAELLHADVVDVEGAARSHGANAVKNIFRVLRARHRVHHHVGVGQNAVNGVGHGARHLFRALEGDVTIQPDGQIGEVAVAGAPNADAIQFEHARYARYGILDLRSHAFRSCIKERVNGAAGQP